MSKPLRRSRFAGCAATAWALCAAGCGSSTNNPPPLGDIDGGGRDVYRPPIDASGLETGAPEGSTVEAGADGGPLGGLMIIDEPDTPCTMKGGTSVTVFGADAGPLGAPPITSMQTVGTRRVGGGDLLQGFVTFGLDGSNPNPSVVSLGVAGTAFASQGTTIGAIGYAKDKVTYQQYDPSPAPVGPSVSLNTDTGSGAPLGLSMASGAAGTLAVWGEAGYTYVMGAGVPPPPGTTATSFQITAIPDLSQFLSSVAATSSGFAVVWSTDPPTGGTQAYFAATSLAATTLQPVPLATSGISFSVTKLVATANGFALLLNGTQSDFYVLPLDASGNVTGAAHHYLGSIEGWDMALQGSTLGVVATRSTGEPEFRPVDLTGAPTGSWVCLDAPVPGTLSQGLAIDVDGSSGFAVMYTSPAGEDVLVRFNTMGQ